MISGNNRIDIRKATTEDLDAIKSLADAHRHELGFVRHPALSKAIERQEVLVANNGQILVGFVEYRHRQDTQTTLYHVVIKPEYRRRGIGRALLNVLKAESEAKGKSNIYLKCPEDLPARHFYKKIGYQLVNKESDRSRPLLVWQLPLS